jgi:hypothetical protein
MIKKTPFVSDHALPSLSQAIVRLHQWFETTRCADGYHGPVAHWWSNCLFYTGVGLDWRYEGIILGYLALYQKSDNQYWLQRAVAAGDDLVRGQLPTHNFRSSRFELNPYNGGTPHEASCDIGLLSLVQTLQEHSDYSWQPYLQTAARNLEEFYVGRLCHPRTGVVYDHEQHAAFVPNKAATAAEAFILLSRATGDERWADQYAMRSLDHVLEHQELDGLFGGAIHQMSVSGNCDGRFFPYYIVRCASGLFAGYDWFGEERYLDGAMRAIEFVLRRGRDDGSFPQVVYANGHVNEYPRWIAASGDVLRVLQQADEHGLSVDLEPTLTWLRSGQEKNGAFRTAYGFQAQISQRKPYAIPEFRDVVGVAGWTDKAFRFLADLISPQDAVSLSANDVTPMDRNAVIELECVYRGKRMRYRDEIETISLEYQNKPVYVWRKCARWAEISHPELFLG